MDKPHHYLQAKIAMANKLEFIWNFFGCGSMRVERRKLEWRTAYQWQVADSKAIEVAKKLYPRLRLKKRAEVVLDFWEIGRVSIRMGGGEWFLVERRLKNENGCVNSVKELGRMKLKRQTQSLLASAMEGVGSAASLLVGVLASFLLGCGLVSRIFLLSLCPASILLSGSCRLASPALSAGVLGVPLCLRV